MILENGVVRTLDPSLPKAAALAIAGERIAGGVGTHETVLPSPERVDLGGRCVLPGFTDSHVHFPTWALAQRQVRLEGTASLDEALARVAAATADVPRGRWLRGLGWRSGEWSPASEPTKEALDAVTGGMPVALMSKDYHSLWVNSAALAHADGELQVPGGVVERDELGEPTGVLREECAWHFRDTYVRPTVDEMVEACREGIPLAVSRGVVSVHDKDGWLGALRVFQRLRDEGALALRVWQSLPWDHLDRLEEIGLASGLGDDPRSVGGEDLLHAIGDRANRRALDAFEETQDEWRPRGLRQRIEHAQLLAPEDVGRFAALGVAASVQFSHAPSDRDLADDFWAGKTDGAYAFRSLVDSGALVANGSDAPVEELDPLFGIRAGVTRTLDDREAWHPEQAVTVEQALHATCVAPAWLTGDERRRGKLLPGYLADLVVLDPDPHDCPAGELQEIQVVATMVGGRWVHNSPPWD